MSILNTNTTSDPHWGFSELGNLNRTSLTDYVPWPLWEKVLGITYYSLISVIGIIGNLFIIHATKRVKRQSSDQKTLLIIKYLAIIDFLSSAVLYPNFIYFTSVERFNAPAFYCKILGIWEIYFPTTSTFLVLLMVAVKLHMLRHPFYSLSSSDKWLNLGCIAVCLSGLIIPSAPFYNLATYIYCPKRMTCTFDFYPDWNAERSKLIFVTWATTFCCVVPLCVIAVLSYFIIKMVRATKSSSIQKNSTEPKPLGKSVRVVLLVVLAYALTWAAFFIVFTVAFFYRTELIIPRSLLFWPKALLMTNNAVNPIVFIYSNVNIQKYLLRYCLPKCIAQHFKIYKDIIKSEQERIFKTTTGFNCKLSAEPMFAATPASDVKKRESGPKLLRKSKKIVPQKSLILQYDEFVQCQLEDETSTTKTVSLKLDENVCREQTFSVKWSDDHISNNHTELKQNDQAEEHQIEETLSEEIKECDTISDLETNEQST